MSFEDRSTNELVRIAAAGGGFVLTANARTTNDLVRIADAASGTGARITFSGLGNRSTNELVRISNAANGSVILVG